MITPHTVTEPMRPVQRGPPKFATVVSQISTITEMHVAIGVGRHGGEERGEIADGGDRRSPRFRSRARGSRGRTPGRSRTCRAPPRRSATCRRSASRSRRPARSRRRSPWSRPPSRPTTSSEIAPSLAMFVGSMMMPEPIMLTATITVSCIRLIFFASAMAAPYSFDHVGEELDPTVHALLEHALHLVVEAGEAVEGLLEGEEVVEHGLRAVVPALARAPRRRCRAGRSVRASRRSRPFTFAQRHVLDLVRTSARYASCATIACSGKLDAAEAAAAVAP